MRALCLGIAIAAACGTTPRPVATRPVEVEVELDDALHERLAAGVPVALELWLRSPSAAVGTCTLSFDLWTETYRVAIARSDVSTAHDLTLALRRCVDPRELAAHATGGAPRIILAREALPARPPYPVF